MRLALVVSAAALCASTLAARADVVYTLTSTTPTFAGTYSLTLPTFDPYTGALEFGKGELSSNSGTDPNLYKIDIDFLQSWCPGQTGNITGFCVEFVNRNLSNPAVTTVAYSSVGTSLTSYGTYVAGDLTIDVHPSTSTPVAAQTPEPSSIALLGTGLLGIGGIVRRRLV